VDFLFSLIRDLLIIAILLRVILSWVFPRSTNVLALILYRVTEPFLASLRRIIPRVGMFDFTPLVAIILIQLIYRLLYYLLS
jgi:YggT family protein